MYWTYCSLCCLCSNCHISLVRRQCLRLYCQLPAPNFIFHFDFHVESCERLPPLRFDPSTSCVMSQPIAKRKASIVTSHPSKASDERTDSVCQTDNISPTVLTINATRRALASIHYTGRTKLSTDQRWVPKKMKLPSRSYQE